MLKTKQRRCYCKSCSRALSRTIHYIHFDDHKKTRLFNYYFVVLSTRISYLRDIQCNLFRVCCLNELAESIQWHTFRQVQLLIWLKWPIILTKVFDSITNVSSINYPYVLLLLFWVLWKKPLHAIIIYIFLNFGSEPITVG